MRVQAGHLLKACCVLAIVGGWSHRASADFSADILPHLNLPGNVATSPITLPGGSGAVDYLVGFSYAEAAYEDVLVTVYNQSGNIVTSGSLLSNQPNGGGGPNQQTVDLGTLTAGDFIVFAVKVNNGDVYYSPIPVGVSPGSDLGSLLPITTESGHFAASDYLGTRYIGFEDINPLSASDHDYNDLIFSLSAGVSTGASVLTPEPASLAGWSLLGLTIGGAQMFRRRKSK